MIEVIFTPKKLAPTNCKDIRYLVPTDNYNIAIERAWQQLQKEHKLSKYYSPSKAIAANRKVLDLIIHEEWGEGTDYADHGTRHMKTEDKVELLCPYSSSYVDVAYSATGTIKRIDVVDKAVKAALSQSPKKL